jgi:hypothetical protein
MKTITLIFALSCLSVSFGQAKKKNERLRMELKALEKSYDSLGLVYGSLMIEVNTGIKQEYLTLMAQLSKSQTRITELKTCIESNQNNLSRLKEQFTSLKEVQLPTVGSKAPLAALNNYYKMIFPKIIPIGKSKEANRLLKKFIEEYRVAFQINEKIIRSAVLCKTELRSTCDTLSEQLKAYIAYEDYLEVENQKLANQLGELEQDFRSKDPGTFPAVYQEVFTKAGKSIVKEPAEKEPFSSDQVDQEAEFPGGRHAILKYLIANLHMPDVMYELGISGKGYFKFVIQEDGSVSDVKVLKGFLECPECDQEAIRTIENMPKWKPAMIGGKPVKVNYALPITIHLD